jgi:hypothetical protein
VAGLSPGTCERVRLLKPVKVRQNRARSGFAADARTFIVLPTCGYHVADDQAGEEPGARKFRSCPQEG